MKRYYTDEEIVSWMHFDVKKLADRELAECWFDHKKRLGETGETEYKAERIYEILLMSEIRIRSVPKKDKPQYVVMNKSIDEVATELFWRAEKEDSVRGS